MNSRTEMARDKLRSCAIPHEMPDAIQAFVEALLDERASEADGMAKAYIASAKTYARHMLRDLDPGRAPVDDLIGLLSQIDNAVAQLKDRIHQRRENRDGD